MYAQFRKLNGSPASGELHHPLKLQNLGKLRVKYQGPTTETRRLCFCGAKNQEDSEQRYDKRPEEAEHQLGRVQTAAEERYV